MKQTMNLKDIVDSFYNPHLPIMTIKGKWILGQTSYVAKIRGGNYVIKNTPY